MCFLKMMTNLNIKWKNFYKNIFDPPEDEIKFDNFFMFSFLSLRLVFLEPQHLNVNATLKIKVQFYARKLFNVFCLLTHNASIIQLIVYGAIHYGNFDVLVRAISDASTFFFIMLGGLALFLREKSIRAILEELKILFESRNDGNDGFSMKSYLDRYHRFMKLYIGIFVSTNLAAALSWIPYLLNGSAQYPINYWFPFDEYNTDMVPFATIWIQWIGYWNPSYLMASNSLLYALTTVISMEFDFLKNNVKSLKINTKDQVEVKMAFFIDRHNKLLDICEKLKNIFEHIFLFNFIISSFVICVASFQFLKTATNTLTYIIDIIYILYIYYIHLHHLRLRFGCFVSLDRN